MVDLAVDNILDVLAGRPARTPLPGSPPVPGTPAGTSVGTPVSSAGALS
jgi:glyoxylate reductase